MNRILNVKIFFCNVIILVCANMISTEDDIEGVNLSSSLDSLSEELYNFTSKEKPRNRYLEEIPNTSIDNILSELTDDLNNDNMITIKNSMEMPAEVTTTTSPMDTEPTFSNFSFTVTIMKHGSHYASGALVNKLWILSVAEPFYNVRESIKHFKARVGSINCKHGGTLLYLTGIEIHPQYEYKKPNFDLALLRIGKTGKDIKVHPIRILTRQHGGSDINKVFWAAYWPRLIVDGMVLSPLANERYHKNIMRISYQKPILWNDCQDILEKTHVILNESSICLEPIKPHHSRCLPDPGAPLVADNYLWGITSGWTSKKCLNRPSPTLATAVSSPSVLYWIYSVFDDLKPGNEEEP